MVLSASIWLKKYFAMCKKALGVMILDSPILTYMFLNCRRKNIQSHTVTFSHSTEPLENVWSSDVCAVRGTHKPLYNALDQHI